MEYPLVTIIVPIYNVEKYINACLDSLENQTLSDIEVILVNDGSTDMSRKIALKYVEKNKNFQLIDRKNGGSSAARNTGIKHAKGKYLYFIDSDDYLVNTAVEELFQKAELERLDVLKFSAYTFEDDSNKGMEWAGYRYKGSYPDVYSGIGLLQRMKANRDNIPSPCLVFIRRQIVEENCLQFYEGITYEDNLFHWKLLVVCQRTAVLNKPLYCRRIRKGSVTQNSDYYVKWRSLVIGSNAAHHYFCKHTELHGTGIEWYYFRMLRAGINDGYMLMDKSLRNTREARQLHKREKRILRDLHYGNSLSIFLYTVCPIFYIPFGFLRKLVKKLI